MHVRRRAKSDTGVTYIKQSRRQNRRRPGNQTAANSTVTQTYLKQKHIECSNSAKSSATSDRDVKRGGPSLHARHTAKPQSHLHLCVSSTKSPKAGESDGSQLSSAKRRAHISNRSIYTSSARSSSLSGSLEREPRRDSEDSTPRSTSACGCSPESECCH